LVDVSVVIASFNSVEWLPSTIQSLERAAALASQSYEIIIVDDGSTDGTWQYLVGLQQTASLPVKIIHQENQGRFMARWAGIEASSAEFLLIFDSRILIDEESLLSLEWARPAFDKNVSWNAHIETDAKAPLVGRFWEVPTYVFWGNYLAQPRQTILTLENFDYMPKGTTCFFVTKAFFREACLAAWPDKNARLTSDDTKIIRKLLEMAPIVVDPSFVATYRPRVTVDGFLKHAFNRGTLFVDSYAGTSKLRNSILVALGMAPFLLIVAVLWTYVELGLAGLAVLFVALVLLVFVPAVIAAFRRCPWRAIGGYLTFVVPFSAVFWAGLTRGIFVHRATFSAERVKGEL
jgi:glycosyltransferase involved in cell wall biosynthesis